MHYNIKTLFAQISVFVESSTYMYACKISFQNHISYIKNLLGVKKNKYTIQ